MEHEQEDLGLDLGTSESFLVNWLSYFSQLKSFLAQVEAAEHPSHNYCEFVVERLEIWLGARQCHTTG